MADVEETGQALIEMVYRMVSGMVDHPGSVLVKLAVPREGALALDVSVHGNDLGYVIGKQGRTARSLRMIVAACAAKAGAHCEVQFMTATPEVSHGG